jgi:hypothetical protein
MDSFQYFTIFSIICQDNFLGGTINYSIINRRIPVYYRLKSMKSFKKSLVVFVITAFLFCVIPAPPEAFAAWREPVRGKTRWWLRSTSLLQKLALK